jgi:hypothetical protein
MKHHVGEYYERSTISPRRLARRDRSATTRSNQTSSSAWHWQRLVFALVILRCKMWKKSGDFLDELRRTDPRLPG